MSNEPIILETDDELALWMAARAEACTACDPAKRADEAVRDLRVRTPKALANVAPTQPPEGHDGKGRHFAPESVAMGTFPAHNSRAGSHYADGSFIPRDGDQADGSEPTDPGWWWLAVLVDRDQTGALVWHHPKIAGWSGPVEDYAWGGQASGDDPPTTASEELRLARRELVRLRTERDELQTIVAASGKALKWTTEDMRTLSTALGFNRLATIDEMVERAVSPDEIDTLRAEREEHIAALAAARQDKAAMDRARGDLLARVRKAEAERDEHREAADFLSDLVGDAIVRASLSPGESAVDDGKRHAGHALLASVDRLRERAEDAEAELASVAEALGVADRDGTDLARELSLSFARREVQRCTLREERDRLAAAIGRVVGGDGGDDVDSLCGNLNTVAQGWTIHAKIASGLAEERDDLRAAIKTAIEESEDGSASYAIQEMLGTLRAALGEDEDRALTYHQAWGKAKDRDDYDEAAWNRSQALGEALGSRPLDSWIAIVYGTAAMADPTIGERYMLKIDGEWHEAMCTGPTVPDGLWGFRTTEGWNVGTRAWWPLPDPADAPADDNQPPET